MTSIYRDRHIREQVAAVHNGTRSAAELATSVRTDITRYEPKLRAWVTLTGDTELSGPTSDSAVGTLPLAGVSLGVKDIIDVAGLPTRSGSEITAATAVDTDAACVARLRELGAIIQGKTVTTEFGYFKPGPTANPWSHRHSPGGSSSGSAAAVGANTIELTLGTQTAGSLTRPASFCGAAGMVLATGSTPMAGIHGLSESLDSLGLLTRSAEDLHYVWSAFTGEAFPEDPDLPPVTPYLWDGSDLLPLAPQMNNLLHDLPERLGFLGLQPEPLDWSDHVQTLADDHRIVMGYEAARTMAPVIEGREEQLSHQLRDLLGDGARIDIETYREALIRRDISLRALHRLLGEDGIIIGPAAQGPAPEREHGTGSPDLSRPWQLLGLPVVVVPGARSNNGLPLGIQLIGLPGSEPRLLALARHLEPVLRRAPSYSENFSEPTLKDLTW